MTIDVGKVKRFLVGLYGEGLLKEAMPDLTARHLYIGRDLRAVVPLKHELSGYHARWFSWFSHGPSSVDIDFPPRIHFTKPGDKQADEYHLELERVGGVDGVINWVAENNLALQVSISYTSVGKGRLGRVYSGDVHALYLLMVEFEDKKGDNNLKPVKKVVNEVVDRAATFVEEPFIVFSGNKSFYLVFSLPTPLKAGFAVVRDRFGRVVREYSLSEVYRALFNLVLRDKAYLGLGSEVITRFVDAQVAEPKRLLRVPGFKHEKSGRETTQLDVDLRPTDFDPDALAKSMLPNSVLTDYWAYIELPKPEKASSSGVTTYTTQNSNNKTKGCLPTWVRALINYLIETGELCHYGRMAVAGWMLWCGFTDEEIHEVFRHAHDYKPGTTQYHINDVRKYLEAGGKPMSCETVVERCNGYKVPDIDCTSAHKHPTQTKPLEDKPEIQPTPVTETRPEVKPTEPKPEEPIPETQVSKSIPTSSPEVPKPQVTQPTPSPEVQAIQPKPESQPKPTQQVSVTQTPETNPTPKPKAPLITTSNNNKRSTQVSQGKQARLTGFIDKPRQPTTQSIEEDWSKILRPEKKKVIPCSELGDECKFFHNCLELFEWRSWSGEPVFQRPRGYFEIEGLFTSEEHERLHKQLYDLIINGKLQEALKLWEEIAEKELPIRIEKARRRNKELLSEWVRENCSDSVVVNP